jgi:ribosomal protein S18 acetylase RimI-like enzyme
VTVPQIAVRRAVEGDLPALGRMGAELMRMHFAFDPRRFMDPGVDPESGYSWFLGTQIHDDEVAIFVAELDGLAVGYVYAGLEPQSWKELREASGFVHDIVVSENARRAGVATALMDAALGWLKSRGAPRVMLWTAEPNRRAQQLFDRLGFRRTMVEMTKEL